MKRLTILITFLMMVFVACVAKDITSTFVVRIDTIGKYIHVDMTCTPADGSIIDEDITLKMPVWAPGYYLIVDFPKHLTDFAATDQEGKALTWKKQGKNGWVVNSKGTKTIKATYRIFATARSVAECRVESYAAFIAPNGVFMHVEGQKEKPAYICFEMPSNWKSVSTGMKTAPARGNDGKTWYYAPDFDVLYDSPILLGNHLVDKFEHEGHPFEFALESPIGYETSTFKEDFKKIVTATTGIMQHIPYDNYCLIHLGQGPGGLEHLNSQACYTEGTFNFPSRDAYIEYLDFAAHEYFHLYNVKHIRPIELGPFDYDREVFTPLLWVSEGFTCYYSAQILRQAGLIDAQKQLSMYSEYIHNTETQEGHHHMSLRQSSYDIWLNFFNHDENSNDVRISYYVKGPVMGLLFDIELRRVTNGEQSLDDLMRLLYNRYDQELGRGFTEEEFWQCALEVATVTSQHGKASNETEAERTISNLRRLVDTTDEIDYDAMLAPVGLTIDHQTWQMNMVDKPTKQQKKLRQQIFGE
ncbi:MAG: M61 family metallopeptidase [Bacteroidaceae bacterium]|nr:M61 family metallopeptidase [Bacteroidaceae bacterium]